MKTLQIFNIYQFRGGEEDTVRLLSNIHGKDEWQDCFFESASWLKENWAKKWTQPFRAIWNPSAISTIRRRQRVWKADIWLFHNIMPVGSLGLYKIAMDEGVPVIQYLHNYRPFSLNGLCYHDGQLFRDGFKGWFLPEILAGTYRGSIFQSAFMAGAFTWLRRSGWLGAVKGWISQTQIMKKEFVTLANIDPDKILVQLPPRARSISRCKNVAEEDYVFLVSRLVPEKGIRIAISAWKRHFRSPGSPRLVIAGIGPLSAEVQLAAAECCTISYVGKVSNDEKFQLAARSRALLAPSLWPEVLGLVTFEAYEAARPMLAARCGGFIETVRDGITGLLHNPGDVDDLARTVKELWALSPTERAYMGEAGRRWMEQETDPETWKSRYRAFARKIS